jgi:hypothetical protein
MACCPGGLSAGVCEEVVFHTWMLNVLHRWVGLGGWTLLLVTAAVFGVVHSYQGPVGVLATGVMGFYLCGLYVMNRNVACTHRLSFPCGPALSSVSSQADALSAATGINIDGRFTQHFDDCCSEHIRTGGRVFIPCKHLGIEYEHQPASRRKCRQDADSLRFTHLRCLLLRRGPKGRHHEACAIYIYLRIVKPCNTLVSTLPGYQFQ